MHLLFGRVWLILVSVANTSFKICYLTVVTAVNWASSLLYEKLIQDPLLHPGIFMMRALQTSSSESQPTLSLATPRRCLLGAWHLPIFCSVEQKYSFFLFAVQVPGRRGLWAELQRLHQRGFCQVLEEKAAWWWEDYCAAGQSCRGWKITRDTVSLGTKHLLLQYHWVCYNVLKVSCVVCRHGSVWCYKGKAGPGDSQ